MPDFTVGYWTDGVLKRVDSINDLSAERAYTRTAKGLRDKGYDPASTRLTVCWVDSDQVLFDRLGDGSPPPNSSPS